MLVAAGAQLFPDSDARDSVLCAVAAGDLNQLERVLSDNDDLLSSKQLCRDMLVTAVGLGRTELLRSLVRFKSFTTSLSVPTDENWTAVTFAVDQGRIEHVHILVEAGADVLIKTVHGDTLLHIAAMKGNALMLRHLLSLPELRGPVLLPGGDSCRTTGMESSAELSGASGTRESKSSSLERLLSPQCFRKSINTPDFRGNTALMKAVGAGSLECYRILRDAGAEVGGQNKGPRSALHLAAGVSDQDLLDLVLRDHIGDLNMQDKFDEMTPLKKAASAANIPWFKRLLDAGADRSFRSRYVSLRYLSFACVTLFILHGPPPFYLAFPDCIALRGLPKISRAA
eukprot:m.66446 g.66446  ORF g.66446 m.66446 type:complete len:342 (+) comp49888_c0_seq7:811-1836(+)